VWENMNATFPEVNLNLTGNYRNIDIAPQEIITMTLQASDTFRGHTWTGKAFTPRSISWNYDAEKSTFLPNISLHEITQGNAGQTIDIPVTPPDDGYDQPPPIVPPVVPPLPIPIPTTTVSTFAPVLRGLNSTTSSWVDLEGSLTGFNGIVMNETDRISAYGTIMTPDGWSGTLTVYSIFRTTLQLPSTYLYMGSYVQHDDFTPNFVGLQSVTPIQVDATGAAGAFAVLPNTFSVTNQSLLRLITVRYADNALDTADTRQIYYLGWWLVYS